MSSRDLSEPRLLRHAKSGRAFIVVRDAGGRRRQVSLGAWPDACGRPSPEAQRRYHAELLRWHARQRGGEAAAALIDDACDNPTIAEAVARWITTHIDIYHRRADGSPTSEVELCRAAARPLLELFGDEPLAEFTPRKLKAVRERMVNGDPRAPAGERRGWCRSYANSAVGRLRRFAKWCVSEGLASPMLHAGLTTLPPLKRGRTSAREAPLRHPVADADVELTIPHLPPAVADMVRIQHLIGMRGGELCEMTTAELDRSESSAPGCWVFRPTYSKLSYRGRQVEYAVGPRAVAILTRYLKADPQAPLFAPSESELARRQAMRERRRTRVQPSQFDRSKPNPQKQPGDRYTSMTYARAIRRACEKAGVKVWQPHDLRRAVATRIRARFGIEAARCALAHQSVEMAALYGHRDLKTATDIAREVG